MQNFVFSKTLEVSILDHRLLNLFEMMEKVDINYFFPYLLFNETFWQLEYQKKLAILSSNQSDWLGDDPFHRLYLIKDPYYLEIMRSVKITYFSYTKLKFDAFAEIMLTKNKYALMDFAQFGAEEKGPFEVLNTIIRTHLPEKKRGEEDFTDETLAKIDALKYYSTFSDYTSITNAFIAPLSIIHHIENFVQAIKLIDENTNTNVLGNSIFYFLPIDEIELQKLEQELNKYPLLNELRVNGKIHLEVITLIKFASNRTYDFVFLNRALNSLPSEILLKYNTTVYSVNGRLTYTRRENNPDAEHIVKKLLGDTTQEVQIKEEDLNGLDFEIVFKPFVNQKALDLLTSNTKFRERMTTRFSVTILRVLVELIKSLNPKGYIHVWDYLETKQAQNSLGLMRHENGEVYTPVNLRLYAQILTSFSDLPASYTVQSKLDYIADGLESNTTTFTTLEKIAAYMNFNPYFARIFFDLENLSTRIDLEQIIKKLSFYENLKRKNIIFLGIPSLLYKFGFLKFKKTIFTKTIYKTSLNPTHFTNYNTGSYESEFLLALVYEFSKKMQEKKDMIVEVHPESSHNVEFYKLLNEYGFDQDKVMAVLQNSWDEITSFAAASNAKLLEIKNTL